METLEELIASCRKTADSPRASLESYLAKGMKAMGVMPYYLPEELVHAAGAVPFGVWGAMGTALEAKSYFPPFYCSICQMTLEMGLTGKLRGLSGLMVGGLCDTLKAFSQNWKAGVGSAIPMVYVYQPQNRFSEAGHRFANESYEKARLEVQECLGTYISDDNLNKSIEVYDQWRREMREFVKLAGTHPEEVSASARAAVIEAGSFMRKEDHLEIVKQINAQLAVLPESLAGHRKVFLTGIYENIPEVLSLFDEYGYAVVGDDLARESRAFALEAVPDKTPIKVLAEQFCAAGSDPILFDPKKAHIEALKKAVQETGAEGVISIQAKFCDPEEFERPYVAKACDELGVPLVTIEVDQMTESYGQASTQFEAFNEMFD